MGSLFKKTASESVGKIFLIMAPDPVVESDAL
jgi:hypothetical protein